MFFNIWTQNFSFCSLKDQCDTIIAQTNLYFIVFKTLFEGQIRLFWFSIFSSKNIKLFSFLLVISPFLIWPRLDHEMCKNNILNLWKKEPKTLIFVAHVEFCSEWIGSWFPIQVQILKRNSLNKIFTFFH